MKLTLIRIVAILALLPILWSGAAHATSVNPFTDLASAGPTYWGVLGLTSTSVTVEASAVVNGNIGVAPSGSLSFDTTSHDYGTADVDTGGTVTDGGQASGGVVQNSATNTLLNTASAAALKASADAAAMSATITSQTNINNPTAPITITGVAGINVVDLSNLVLQSPGDGLVLKAPSNGYFVINVSGNFTVSNGADITLAGGIGQYNVMYDVTGTGSTVTFNGSNQNTVVDGIVLAPSRDIDVNGSWVNGEVVGGGGQIWVENNGEVGVPEPGTCLLLASGLGFITLLKRRGNVPSLP